MFTLSHGWWSTGTTTTTTRATAKDGVKKEWKYFENNQSFSSDQFLLFPTLCHHKIFFYLSHKNTPQRFIHAFWSLCRSTEKKVHLTFDTFHFIQVECDLVWTVINRTVHNERLCVCERKKLVVMKLNWMLSKVSNETTAWSVMSLGLHSCSAYFNDGQTSSVRLWMRFFFFVCLSFYFAMK